MNHGWWCEGYWKKAWWEEMTLICGYWSDPGRAFYFQPGEDWDGGQFEQLWAIKNGLAENIKFEAQ